MSTFSNRQIALILKLYEGDGRIDSYEISSPHGAPVWLVRSKHIDAGSEQFNKAQLVRFLKSIGDAS
jgi:hypothetical protein